MATPLQQPHFQNADKARAYLERLRWPNGPICPHCGSIDEHYQITGKSARPGLWKCKDCREQFTVTVGTVFERSKIALHVWLQAVYLLCSAKKGISSHQLHRTLGVTYKTAWFMSHRIREAMTTNPAGLMGGGGGTVEADETFWGNNKPRKPSKGRGYYNVGNVMSCAALIFLAGDERYAINEARFQFHQTDYDPPSGKIGESYLTNTLKSLRYEDGRSEKLVSSKIGQPISVVRKWRREGRFIGSDEAIAVGIIQGIRAPSIPTNAFFHQVIV